MQPPAALPTAQGNWYRPLQPPAALPTAQGNWYRPLQPPPVLPLVQDSLPLRTLVSKPAASIVLVNQYAESVQIKVNNQRYLVSSGTARTLSSRDPGPFTYEVITGTSGSKGQQGRVLQPGERFIITVSDSP